MIKGNQRSNGLLSHSPIIKNSNLYTDGFINNSGGSYLKARSIHNIIESDDIILTDVLNQHHLQQISHSRNNNHNNDNSNDNIMYNVFDEHQNKLFQLNMKDVDEEDNLDDEFDTKSNLHSIIGLSNDIKSHKKINLAIKTKLKKTSLRGTYHETLQRIDPCNINHNHYQQHWFSGGLERLKLEDRSRQERLEITRYELRRHLKQILQCDVGNGNQKEIITSPSLYETNDEDYNYLIPLSQHQQRQSMYNYDRLVAPRDCDVDKCLRKALPCTIYCLKHIMNNKDQVLFNYCTAKFADNRQCSAPVFDILHELPLCPEHARKRDNYKMYQETKPKKLRKKVKTSAMIRPQKRSKKKKKIIKTCNSNNMESLIIEHGDIPDVQEDSEEFVEDMVEQVLAMDGPDELELTAVDHNLVTQATHLLEEPDITNVLNTIQADEFSDFFAVNRNGEYEPTREETEELERALAAVDNDVKSLEKLSQTHGLLDSLLDEQTLVESLVQIPDVFHNGYVTNCGSGSVVSGGIIGGNNVVATPETLTVVGQTSRLLQIEPHTQS